MTTVLKTIDVGANDTILSHLEAAQLFSASHAEARSASAILAALLSDPDNAPPMSDQPLDHQRWQARMTRCISSLPDHERESLELALTDAHVVPDPFEPGMTRMDLPDRIEGVIVSDDLIHPLHEPKPGSTGSPYDDKQQWAMDQLTTVLTGIHPERGEVSVTVPDLDRLLLKPAFRRLLVSLRTGDQPTYTRSSLIRIFESRGVHGVSDSPDEELTHPRTRRSSPRWLPPPDPSDEVPPDAVRPRTTGRSLVHGSIMFDSETTPVEDMTQESARIKRHLTGDVPIDWPSVPGPGNSVSRTTSPPPITTPAVVKALSDAAAALDRQVDKYMKAQGAVTRFLHGISTRSNPHAR